MKQTPRRQESEKGALFKSPSFESFTSVAPVLPFLWCAATSAHFPASPTLRRATTPTSSETTTGRPRPTRRSSPNHGDHDGDAERGNRGSRPVPPGRPPRPHCPRPSLMTPNQVVIVEEITTLPCWPNPSGHARFARGYAGAGTRSTRTCVPPSPLIPKQRRVDDGWLEDDRRNSVRSGSLYIGAVFRGCHIAGEVTARPSFDGWSFMGYAAWKSPQT